MQTSNLDGERALKHKQCLRQMYEHVDENGLDDLEFKVHFENPHKDLYSFNGLLELGPSN